MTPTDQSALKKCFMDLLEQACGDGWDEKTGDILFDSMTISAYENALQLAVDFGWIKEEQVTR